MTVFQNLSASQDLDLEHKVDQRSKNMCSSVPSYCLNAKSPDIYILLITGKPEQQHFTIRSGILTSITVGSGAHLAADHCPNEQTLTSSTSK